MGFALAGFSFAINLLLLVPAIYMLQVYDRVLSSRNELTLVMLSLIAAGLYALEALIELLRSRVLVRASAALDMSLNERVFEAALARQLRAGRGGIGQALGDLASLRGFATGPGVLAFFDAPWVPIFVAALFLLHPWLGVFAIAAMLALLAVAALTERSTAPLLGEAGRQMQAGQAYAAGGLRNAEAAEAMGMGGALRRRWLARHGDALALHGKASDQAALMSAAARFLRLALQSGILGVGALLVLRGQLTAGAMVAAAILLGRALAPMEQAIAHWRGFVAARNAYARLGALVTEHPARAEALALPRPAGRIEVDKLVVCAPGSDAQILKGVSFRAGAGITAIIGPSAAGKSTLARALVGVWPPHEGTVRIDGAELRQWDPEKLGPWIGYLPQDVGFFEGSVAENIGRFGERDPERIVEAAKRAGVHEMVLRLPQGYETAIGEGGAALSGGERQRIALARALYGEPALVVLDEPNASLDEAGDAALIAAVRELQARACTVFVVTHRANLLNVADNLLVLSAGRLQAFGPRETVLRALAPRLQSAGEARRQAGARREGEA